MSNPIRLYFKHFSIGQDLSPIPYEQKMTRFKLMQWCKDIRPQLVKVRPFRSKDFPININIRYFVCKDSFDINEFLLKTYWLLRVLEQTTIIQSINNNFINGVRFEVKTISNPENEGCEIKIIKKSEINASRSVFSF